MKIPPGRHDARGSDVRHMPCNLSKSYKPHLKPLKRKIMERAREMHQEALLRAAMEEQEQESESSLGDEFSARGFFMTEAPTAKEKQKAEKPETLKKIEDAPAIAKGKGKVDFEKPKDVPFSIGEVKSSEFSKVAAAVQKKMTKRPKSASTRSSEDLSEEEMQKQWEEFVRKNYDWDAFMLQQVSANTARWIVLERMPPGEERDKMRRLVESWYGKQDSTDLLLSDLGETGEREKEQEKQLAEKKKKKQWQKPEAS